MSLASQLSDGQGGLQFTAQAPPGIGRLIRIPFYLTTAAASMNALQIGVDPGVAYSTVAGNASTTVPAILVAASANNGVGATGTLVTPQISWATLRIVGFECSISRGKSVGRVGAGEVVFQDLQIGGGANLFIHEDWGPSGLYLSSNDNFAGLRDYPLLRSPNTARVSMGVTGCGTAAVNSTAVTPIQHQIVTANLVCEILQDDNYGSHVPGPYARKGAMVRRGGSFIS